VEPETVPAWQRERRVRWNAGSTVNGLDPRARFEPAADAPSVSDTGARPVLTAVPAVAPAGGTAPAFRELYDQYFGFVWRCAANRGVRPAALDDVVQEVFIVVHRKLPEFEGRSSLRTWLAAIVRRVVADYLHKRGNQPAADEPLIREPAAGESPADQLEQKAAVTLLEELLTKMTAEQREVFVLHELEQLSGPEIAELTASNENTVWTRLRAARRIFQEGVARQQARRVREQS
jgi:RNA polymerase sigma-70 factor (ECF subfamily)